MKTKRFFSVFFAVYLLLNLICTPVLAAEGEHTPTLPEDPNILAKAAVLVDAETGALAYGKNEHQELYPASLTKVMTALLVLDAIDAGKLKLDTPLTASATAFEGLSADGSTANIKVGETLTVEDLLYCMLVVSANEACDILAEGVSGSVSAFVSSMNAKAQELGCKNTHFANPNGLHDPQHYTSAWDLYLITRAAMEYPEFMTVCNTPSITVTGTNAEGKEVTHALYTTNHLLSNWRVIGYKNSEAEGIKTGSTSEAGYCLISSARRGTLHFISVVMGAERVVENNVGNIRSFSETTRMFNWGFDNFTYKNIVDPIEIVREVPVDLSKVDHVAVHPAEEIEVLMPKGLDGSDLERTVTLNEPLEAPVAEGQVLGSMELSYHGTKYATVDLLALHDVEADRMMVTIRDIKLFLAKPSVHYAAIGVVVLLLLLIVWRILHLRSRRRYGRGVSRRSGSYRGGRRR